MAKHDALFFLQNTRLYPWAIVFSILSGARFSRIYRDSRSKERGKRLAEALIELGPAFIKLGQVLSTRSDFLSGDIIRELSLLQDDIPAFDGDVAREIVEKSLGRDIGEVFASFDSTPIAAASVAQVHSAVIRGESDSVSEGVEKRVAVKILRPNIDKIFAQDIDLMEWIARVISKISVKARRLKPVEVVEVLRESVRFELDLRYEAAAASQLKENMRSVSGTYIPRIYWAQTTDRVMVMEYIEGTALSAIGRGGAAIDRKRVVDAIARAFFHQTFTDGFFHADMHPGNIVIMPDNRVALLDFGIVGQLELRDRIYVAMILKGFVDGDYTAVAQSHIDAGFVPRHKSLERFSLACRAIAKPILDRPLNEVSIASLLAQLFKITEEFDMETQPQLLLLQKTMLMVEGVWRMLDEDSNMYSIARPLLEEWAKDNLSTRAQLRRHIAELAEHARKLPDMLEKLERVIDKSVSS